MCEDNQLKRKGIPILSEESSWSEDERYRTPSGTVIPDKNDIRTFFKALQLRSDLPVKEIKIKSREVCSQLRSRENLGDVHSSGTVKTKPIKHRKTVASRRKLVTPKQPRKSTGRTINTRSKTATSTRNSTFEGHQSSSMTEEEMFETPGSEQGLRCHGDCQHRGAAQPRLDKPKHKQWVHKHLGLPEFVRYT